MNGRKLQPRHKMIKWIATYLLLLPLTIFSQVNITNVSLKDPQLNILYQGVENIIQVSGIDIDSTLRITSTNGEALQNHWNKTSPLFYLRAGYTDTDTLRLYQAQNLLLTKIFTISKVGDIVAQLGEIQDTTATIQQILDNPKLNVVIPDCYLDHQYQVISFQVSFLKAKGDTIKTLNTTNGNVLSKEQINITKRLRTGDKIAFTYLTATCPNCANRRLRPLTITIK